MLVTHLLLCRDSTGLSNYFDGDLEQFPGAMHPTLFYESGFPSANGNDAFILKNSGSDVASNTDHFSSTTNSNWPFVFTAVQTSDGAASQAAQSFTINVTSLPAGGAKFRLIKSNANGNAVFQPNLAGQDLVLGPNTISCSAVGFDRYVKFQFNSGAVGFDNIELNSNTVYTNVMEIYGIIGDNPDTQGAGCNTPTCWDTEDAWAWKDTAASNLGNWVYAAVNCTDGSSTTQTSNCPFPLSQPTSVQTIDITFEVNTAHIYNNGGTVGPNGMYAGGGFLGGADALQLTQSTTDTMIWTGVKTIPLSAGSGLYYYTFLNSPSWDADWG